MTGEHCKTSAAMKLQRLLLETGIHLSVWSTQSRRADARGLSLGRNRRVPAYWRLVRVMEDHVLNTVGTSVILPLCPVSLSWAVLL